MAEAAGVEALGRVSAGPFEHVEVIRVQAGLPTSRFCQLVGVSERTWLRWQTRLLRPLSEQLPRHGDGQLVPVRLVTDNGHTFKGAEFALPAPDLRRVKVLQRLD